MSLFTKYERCLGALIVVIAAIFVSQAGAFLRPQPRDGVRVAAVLAASTPYEHRMPAASPAPAADTVDAADAPDAAAAVDLPPDYTLPPITDGLVPVLNRIPTSQKVVFLGIDDGVTRSADAVRLIAQNHIPASLFLNDTNVEPDVGYFMALQDSGAVIENHTVDHADLTKLDYAAQKQEICANADRFGALFNARPTIFRPPYGSYNTETRRAAADCGMRVLINWSAKANGGSMQYQDGNTGLKPGDIVLMHFRPEFAQDFTAYQDAARAARLRTASLERWLR